MSERTSYPPGTPCWVELGTPDIDAAIEFYGGLLGWQVPEQPTEIAEQTGGYRRATKDGADVAGMMPLTEGGQQPAWMTYVSVEDAAATASAVSDAGGRIVVEPMAVLDLGTMAVFTDPTGVAIGAWQPGTFAGAGRVNEPGSLSWNELMTRDPGGSKAFYSAVFGWDFNDEDMGDAGTYTMIVLGEGPVGGLLDMNGLDILDAVPSSWSVYFAVDDADSTAERAGELGGSVIVPPTDIQAGRFSNIVDPGGAGFTVIALSQELAEQAS